MKLSAGHLNRATLARQSLLARSEIDPVRLVGRVGALQAQAPASPYLAMWTRARGFDADAMSGALRTQQLVRATLHRSTLHVLTATDYLASVGALMSVLRTKWMGEKRGLPVHRTLPELSEAALGYANEPRTNIAMRDFVATLGEPVPGDELWRRIRRFGAFLSVPDESAWSFDRRPVHIAARALLHDEPLDEDASLAHVAAAHLRAFGPSRPVDIAQWSGLGVGAVNHGLDRLDDVERHESEDGHELVDLPGSSLPDPDVEAPVRFLPMWDETLLAYRDRSRVLPERYRKAVIARNGDVLPTFLVDGMVAGLWWAEAAPSGGGATIVIEPFADLTRRERDELEVERRHLAAFIATREPAVYARYRR